MEVCFLPFPTWAFKILPSFHTWTTSLSTLCCLHFPSSLCFGQASTSNSRHLFNYIIHLLKHLWILVLPSGYNLNLLPGIQGYLSVERPTFPSFSYTLLPFPPMPRALSSLVDILFILFSQPGRPFASH